MASTTLRSKITEEIGLFIDQHLDYSSRKLSVMIKTQFGTKIGKTTIAAYLKENRKEEKPSQEKTTIKNLLPPDLYFQFIRPLNYEPLHDNIFHCEYELPELSDRNRLIFQMEFMDTQLYLHYHDMVIIPWDFDDWDEDRMEAWNLLHPETADHVTPCCYPPYARGLLFNHPNEVDVFDTIIDDINSCLTNLLSQGWS